MEYTWYATCSIGVGADNHFDFKNTNIYIIFPQKHIQIKHTHFLCNCENLPSTDNEHAVLKLSMSSTLGHKAWANSIIRSSHTNGPQQWKKQPRLYDIFSQ